MFKLSRNTFRAFPGFNWLVQKKCFSAVQLQRFALSKLVNSTVSSGLKSLNVQRPVLATGFLIAYAASPSPPQMVSLAEAAKILSTAEELIERGELEKLCDLLRPYKDSGRVELLWRLAYALFNWRKSSATTLSKEDYHAVTMELYEVAKTALELDNNSAPAHKWFAIALDAKNDLDGFRSRCRTINIVKYHIETSHRLDPTDSTVTHMLGMWYFEVANLSWYQKSIVQAIYGKIEPASYEEALVLFKKAEEASPNFYSMNLLMLGKCHYVLGDEVTAAAYLHRAVSYPKRTVDDHKAHEEASAILKKIKTV